MNNQFNKLQIQNKLIRNMINSLIILYTPMENKNIIKDRPRQEVKSRLVFIFSVLYVTQIVEFDP
jgi:hypothetical protein